MADYIIQGSSLDAIVEAINQKAGTQNTMTPADMVTAIGNIPSGGGSLPSSVTQLSGGSFTPATDAVCNTYNIPHGMSGIPDGFVIWCNDNFDDSSITSTRLYVITCMAVSVNANSASLGSDSKLVYVDYYYRYSDKRTSVNNGIRTATQKDTFMNSNNINYANSIVSYKAGFTYYWLAWIGGSNV